MAEKKTQIPEMKLLWTTLYLRGTAPLIVHAFPEKARKQMLDKQMKVASTGRDARNPHAEVEAARYRLDDGRDGFPAIAFKAAAVTACTSLADMTKVSARQAFRVTGTAQRQPGCLQGAFQRTLLVPIIAPPATVREDVARLSGPGRTPEMRYRPEFWPWGVKIEVQYNSAVISFGQLGTLFAVAGHGVGVGDYRPERDGDCGTFEVVDESQFEQLIAEVDQLTAAIAAAAE